MVILKRKISLGFIKNIRQVSFWSLLIGKKKSDINVKKETLYGYELFSKKLGKGYGVRFRAYLFREKKFEAELIIGSNWSWPSFRSVRLLKKSEANKISDYWNYPDGDEEDIFSTNELYSDNSVLEKNTTLLNNDNNLLDHNLFDLYIKKNGDLLDPSDVVARMVESGIFNTEPTLLSMLEGGSRYRGNNISRFSRGRLSFCNLP